MSFLSALFGEPRASARSPTRVAEAPVVVSTGIPTTMTFGKDFAEKLSVVYGCINIRSDDLSCLPNYVINDYTKERVPHDILYLLNTRPNEMMSPSIRRKLLERSILTTGNAYDWIIRDPVTRRPAQLIPLTGDLVRIHTDKRRSIWYEITDPITYEVYMVPQEDICHYRGPTLDGITGVPVLRYAAEVVESGLAAQSYNKNFYENGGRPSGILTVDADLSGEQYDEATGEPTGKSLKDAIREEWEKRQSGPDNAGRIAILDHGLKYQSLTISQKDAMFIEQQAQTVEDIARYFNVPLYKLQHGKQSYNSNEQNSIEYQGSLRPRVVAMEQELTYKLLTPTEIAQGLEIRTNMMALLRSDSQSRAQYYEKMHNMGAYSINDIRSLEDMPNVEGGDEYVASLNYVPLKDWPELSKSRNGGKSDEPETLR